MLVTITADGSYCQYTKKAGFAFLISSNAGKFHKSGTLKDTKNITEAELKSVANALYFVHKNPELWGVSKIIINVDYIAMESMIFGGTRATKKKKSGKRYRKILGNITNSIGELRKKGLLKYEFRHVKSHTGETNNRSRANAFVDKLAVNARKD